MREAVAARREQEKKSQEAEKERRNREDKEREKRERATFQHLEIPAELGVALSKIDGKVMTTVQLPLRQESQTRVIVTEIHLHLLL